MEDLTGKKFGKLTVLKLNFKIQQYGKNGKKNGNKYYWLCKCECGNETNISSTRLKNNIIKSCGCLQKEVMKQKMTKHAKSHNRIYKIYYKMLGRCYNKTDNKFLYYGGRGITICDEWKNDFKAFYDWSMANGYADNLTIDRIDNDSNYAPSNCRWVDIKTQANNKRNNHYITYNDETHTIKEWSELLNINYSTLHKRITKYKWEIEKAFTQNKRIKHVRS